MNPPETLGLVSFKHNDTITALLHRIRLWARENNIVTLFHPLLAPSAQPGDRVVEDEKSFVEQSDALVSIGGDGTFLSVAHMALFSDKPLVGINAGDLGFLTDIGPESLEANLSKIVKGEYLTIDRKILKAVVTRGGNEIHTFHALNDIFINRFEKPKLASISVWCGNHFINDFRADGIIVATAAGSTAYSLSAGGPIMEPGINALLLTPICPHSLTERPMILPDTESLRCRIDDQNPDLLLSADGLDSCKLYPGDEIVVSYTKSRACLIQLAESSFFESLRSKLCWGEQNRKRDGR